MKRYFTKPWLQAWSGLFINFSAAFFITPFVGFTLSFPKSALQVGVLIVDIILGIIFLTLTVKCEERLKK